MKLDIMDVEDQGSDYLVTLEGPSGKTLKIWVPKEGGALNSSVWDDPKPFGLNLVTAHHYV